MAFSTEDFLWWLEPGRLAGMPVPFIDPMRRCNGGGGLTDYQDELPVLYAAGVPQCRLPVEYTFRRKGL